MSLNKQINKGFITTISDLVHPKQINKVAYSIFSIITLPLKLTLLL